MKRVGGRKGADHEGRDEAGRLAGPEHFGTKLVVSLVLSIMVLMVGYRYWRLLEWRKILFSQQARKVHAVSRTLQVAIENTLKRGRWEDLESLFREVQDLSGIDRVTLFRGDGSILLSSPPSATRAAVSVPTIQRVLKEKKPEGFLGKEEGQQRFHYFTLVRRAWHGSPSVLEVVVSTSLIEQILATRRSEIIFGGLFMGVLILSLSWYFTRRNISRPIAQLIRSARTIGSGDLSPRIPVNRKDELGSLAVEFNRMAEGLERARDRLLEATKRKIELERQLQHSEKLAAVGRLAAGLAHEIGTPLNVISGRAEYLLADMEEEDPKARSLRTIVVQIERITRIIDRLLGYARAHSPQIVLTSLARVLSSVLALLDHELDRRGIQVELKLPPGLPHLAVDPHMLQQVFINLLLNALDAMPEGDRVRIAAEARNDWMEVSVEDAGCGIPAADIPRIFDPFFTTKKPGKGTGLGLSVISGIIQEHGGRIEVTSQVGVGTTFRIHLPRYPDQASGPAIHLATLPDGLPEASSD
ncbi:MAG: HAMP domain-containing protein [Candidatus Tectomicrobia bacterium]|uniref:histidine kinase n=1 Tax=Tectimicrobiota bacterium TaxID=2528274 RepID=A0A932CQB0_UNCTE|nr:HAMP domain-containing protein [Candidatus Tectomicrobia bacterium]